MEKIDDEIFKNWTMDELRQWRDQEKARLNALPKDSEIYKYTEDLVYKITAILRDE